MLGEQLRRLGKHSVVYGLSNVLGALASLILLPVLTRYLLPVEYGILEMLTVFGAQLGILLQLGLGAALFKFVLHNVEYQDDHANIISTAFYSIFVVATLTTVALVPLTPRLAHLLLGSEEHGSLVTWTLVRAVFEAMSVVPMARLRIREASLTYGALNAARVFVLLAFIIITLTVYGYGLVGVVIAMAAESCVFALIATATAGADLAPRFSAKLLRGMLGFGLPLIPYAFAMTVLAVGDRYVIRLLGDLEQVGQYAVGAKLAATLAVVIRAFQAAWPSVMFSMAKVEGNPVFYAKVLTYLLGLLAFCAVAISVFAHELIVLLTTSAFVPGLAVVPILLLAQLCLGAFFATAIGTNLTGKTHLLTVSACIGIAVFVAASAILVPEFQMVGAACATVLGYFALTAASCAFSLRLYPVRYEWQRIALVLVVMALLISTGIVLWPGTQMIDIALKFMVVAAYPGLLYVFGFLSRAERETLRLPL